MDGDQFFVSWDENLIQIKQVAPQELPDPPPQETIPTDKNRVVTALQELLLGQLSNPTIGLLSNYHLAHAENSPMGANDPLCITVRGQRVTGTWDLVYSRVYALQISDLFIRAIDMAKSGGKVIIGSQVKKQLEKIVFPFFMRGAAAVPSAKGVTYISRVQPSTI